MKKAFFLIMILTLTGLGFAQETKYKLSSHILDITQGQPASNVSICLSKMNNTDQWVTLDEKITDKNGRVTDFLKEEKDINHQGVYKLTYFIKPYFEQLGQESFYPFIEVVFELKNNNHYHVPITLSPFGYSTYRGN